MSRRRIHVVYEWGDDLRPHGSAYIRLLRPLSHPAVRDSLDVSFGRYYDGQPVDAVIVDRLWLPEIRRGHDAMSLARALVAEPRLVLLDEPSLGLSPKLTKEIFEIVVRINRERGTTILLVEQNANMALNAADYGYVLENGRIVMEDTCANLREKDDIKEFYLGMKDEGVRGERRWKKKKTWR